MWRRQSSIGRRVLFVVTICLLVFPLTLAQSKNTSKQAASLEKAGEQASGAVRKVVDELNGLLVGYNAIIAGEAKDPQKAYKKLVGDLNGTGKSIDGAKKQLTSLQKEADKFFKAWEADLSAMSSDSIREKSTKRLETARARYAAMGETLRQARDEFAPVVQHLSDQILYLGRDLSPAAIADLQDEAEALNREAKEVTTRVMAMLQEADGAQGDAEDAIDVAEKS